MASADVGVGASLNGGIPFPATNAWNTDISGAPVDPNSDNLIATIGLTKGLHPDFGAGLYNGAPDARWNNDRLVGELAAVKGSDFEVIPMDGLVVP